MFGHLEIIEREWKQKPGEDYWPLERKGMALRARFDRVLVDFRKEKESNVGYRLEQLQQWKAVWGLNASFHNILLQVVLVLIKSN